MNRPPKKRKIIPSAELSAAAGHPSLPGLLGAVGVDIAKAKFDVCYLAQAGARPKRANFPRNASGFAKFIQWLKNLSNGQFPHVCMEDTGCYSQSLAKALYEAGVPVSVVNPAQIKYHGITLNVRTKNDSTDAWVIADYALGHKLYPWKPLEPTHQQLRDVALRRQQVIEMIVQEKNRREACGNPPMLRIIAQDIKSLEKRKAQLWEMMKKLVAEDPRLRLQAELLESIPGIGELTAHLLLAELPPLENFISSRRLCAYAGLSPRQHESGTLKGPTRMCKQGRARLRTVVFMSALSLMNSKSGPLKEFADRLLSRAKNKKCVVGALMRKLMGLVFAILRSGEPFDPGYGKKAA